ncbi:MAG: hypothetical protein H0U23_09910 [Blastocatellia bacterium]|nr:hypothetical protein [Blastocatellia bacterium]
MSRLSSSTSHPGASVSGFYLSNPASHYFAVGKIESDQAQAYAARRGESLGEIERWLAPNLNYEASRD